MRGVYGKPYISLDTVLPLNVLDIEAIHLELASAQKSVIWWGVGARDSSNFNLPQPEASQRVKDFYAKNAGNKKLIESYVQFAHGAYVPAYAVNIAKPNKLIERQGLAREVDTAEAWTRDLNVFPSIQEFIDCCGAFKTTGRISLFVQHTNCSEPIHADYNHAENVFMKRHVAEAEKDFLWINPTGIKRLFVLDEQTGFQHYIESFSAWFNGLDAHGVDAVDRECWTLRIDGVFTDKFRQKIKVLQNG